MGRLITIETLNHQQQFPAYYAEPTGTPRAAIIMIQEIFGLNAGIRSKSDKWAEAGYLAVAPDLFRSGIELDPDVSEQFQEGLDLYERFDQDQGIEDIDATIRFIRAKKRVSKVGCVGYCLGGRLAS
jgi:carboxymethylenebutenolidase